MRIRRLVEIHAEIEKKQTTLKNLWERQWDALGDLNPQAVEAYNDYKRYYEQWLETPVFGCEYCSKRPCQEVDNG